MIVRARAAELFEEQAAPRVIISGAGDDGVNRRCLIQLGVPPSAIQMESKSASTRVNAELTIKLLRAEKLDHVILVTSWYHSRRALATFRHCAPELHFYSRPAYQGFTATRAQWLQLGMAKRVKLEYMGLPELGALRRLAVLINCRGGNKKGTAAGSKGDR